MKTNWTETIERYLREGRTVSGGHHGASGVQKQGMKTSMADRTKGNQLTDTAQGTLSQFEGPVQQSPFYKALLTQGTEATSNAYDRARANTRARAAAAGFGSAQPVEQGAESQLDAAEASSLAKVPNEALLQAEGPAMQAAGVTGNMGMGYGQQGLGYYGDVAQQDMQRQKSGLWNQLWNVADSAAQGAGAALAAG